MAFAGPFNRTGPIGPKGKDGKNGLDGKDGLDGRNGKNGKDGKDGKDGITKVIYSGSFHSGSDSTPTPPSEEILTGTIAPAEIKTIETLVSSTLFGLKYDISLWTTTKTQYCNMNISNDSTGVYDTIYGIVGSRLLKKIDAVLSGPNILFNIENNEAVVLNYKIQKYKL